MNILVIGSGGREHTFAWKLAQSPNCKNLFVTPGNAGTSTLGTNLSVSPTDFMGLERAIITHNIDIVVIGPEDPISKWNSELF